MLLFIGSRLQLLYLSVRRAYALCKEHGYSVEYHQLLFYVYLSLSSIHSAPNIGLLYEEMSITLSRPA